MSIKPPASTQAINRFDVLDAIRARPQLFNPTWSQIFRPVSVGKSAGTFGVERPEDYLANPGQGSLAAPGTKFGLITTRPNELSFATQHEGLRAVYNDADRANYGDVFDYEISLGEMCYTRMMIKDEIRCYSAIFNQTTFPADNVSGMNASNAWSASTGTPVDDVSKMLNQIFLAGGNPMACVGVTSWETFMLLLGQKQLVDRKLSVQVITNLASEANRQQVAAQLGLQDVIVCTLTHNTASEGATASFASVANKNFFGVFQPALTDRHAERCFGRTYYNIGHDGQWVGLGRMDQYYVEDDMATYMRYSRDIDMRINFASLFKLIGNCNP